MNGKEQLAIGTACGLALAAAIGALLGAGGPSAPPALVGLTSYTGENGIHCAIAWEMKGSELLPVSTGRVFTSPEALIQTTIHNVEMLAGTQEERQAIVSAMQAAGAARTAQERDKHYKEAAQIIRLASTCPACYADYDKCPGNSTECMGRLVLCVMNNCH